MTEALDTHLAVIVVDMQNDFVDPQGSLYVKGAETIVPEIVEDIKYLREFGALVLFTQDWHPEYTPHFDTWPVHCVQNTWGAELVPEIEQMAVGSFIIRKGQSLRDGYSGFEGDEFGDSYLDQILVANHITEVWVMGVALDFCVGETATDAVKYGYKTLIPLEKTRAVRQEPESLEVTHETLKQRGVELYA